MVTSSARALAILLFTGCIPLAPVFAQTTQTDLGVIAGIVHDSAGNGLASASITIVDQKGSEIHGTTVFNGRFAIPGLHVGIPYTVKITKLEYDPITTDSLIIPANKVLRLNYTLQRNHTHQLENVSISQRPKGSKLAKKYLDATEIAKANVHSALDAVQRLRPIMLAANHDICMTRDSLSLYVDGVRRPVANPTSDGSPKVRGMPTGLSNEEVVRSTLSEILADEVAEITFVACDDYNPKIPHRNAIWLITKRYQEQTSAKR